MNTSYEQCYDALVRLHKMTKGLTDNDYDNPLAATVREADKYNDDDTSCSVDRVQDLLTELYYAIEEAMADIEADHDNHKERDANPEKFVHFWNYGEFDLSEIRHLIHPPFVGVRGLNCTGDSHLTVGSDWFAVKREDCTTVELWFGDREYDYLNTEVRYEKEIAQ